MRAVGGCQQFGLTVQWVADHDAVRRVPEGHAIEEPLWVLLGVFKQPVLARIRRLIDARLVALSDRQQVSGLAVDGVHVAEVELLGPDDRPSLPRLATVFGTNECPARPADPNDVTADDAQSVQASVGVRFLKVPLAKSGRNK